jgi:magnesium transporter
VPFLSDIHHRRVLDAGGDTIGRLRDVAVMPDEQIPAVRWAILGWRDGERVIRWADVAIEPAHVRLRRRLESIAAEALPEGALRLGRDLLDQAVAAGRVTDLHLEETGGQLRLLGADVGWAGLLRRIGIERPVGLLARLAGRPLRPRIVAWSEVRAPRA